MENRKFIIKVTVQSLIDALSKIEDKEQYVVLSTDENDIRYMQHIYALTDTNEKDDPNVIALTSGSGTPSEYYNPVEINI